MPNPTSVSEYSRRSVGKFVQTAVFVDDKIYDLEAEPPVQRQPLTKPPARKRKAALKSVVKAHVATELQPAPSIDASPQDILVSFAKKRVVCSLYQPKRNASVGLNSDAYHLCSSADIVIVDWDLHGDHGQKAKELIKNLIVQSLAEVPQQIRLVLVYTAERTLSVIADQVYDELKLVVEPTKQDGGLAMHSDNSRVVILGKETAITRHQKYKDYVVPGDDIAERALVEFGKLAGGLLQGAVLEGLGEIRRNSRRVLSKFDASLDAAFLTHRALSLPHENANEHIWPMVVAQIESILADCIGDPEWEKALLEDWCEQRWSPTASVRELEAEGAKQLPLVKAFCERGPEASSSYEGLKTFAKNKDNKGYFWQFGWDKIRKLESLLLKTPTDDANRTLAQLMSQRTYYADGRTLKLGTILKTSDKFLVCLQPVCDCVRLEAATPFIFCSVKESDKKANMIVIFDNIFRRLELSPGAATTVMKTFVPNHVRKCVVAELNNEKYVFSTENGEALQWIGELKPEHAQRVAEQFAREISRVGLTESEWLRLNSKS
jgi:hypothetical protein